MRTLTADESLWIALAIRAERDGDFDLAHKCAQQLRRAS